jgi:hypothetical protein
LNVDSWFILMQNMMATKGLSIDGRDRPTDAGALPHWPSTVRLHALRIEAE